MGFYNLFFRLIQAHPFSYTSNLSTHTLHQLHSRRNVHQLVLRPWRGTSPPMKLWLRAGLCLAFTTLVSMPYVHERLCV